MDNPGERSSVFQGVCRIRWLSNSDVDLNEPGPVTGSVIGEESASSSAHDISYMPAPISFDIMNVLRGRLASFKTFLLSFPIVPLLPHTVVFQTELTGFVEVCGCDLVG